MTSDNYNTASYGEGLNFSDDWLNLPPQFMGTATSFGQQPTAALGSPVHGIPGNNYHDLLPSSSTMMPPPPPPLPQSVQTSLDQPTSADVLAAATLLQNGSLSRPSSSTHTAMFAARDMGSSIPPPLGHLRHQSMADFRQGDRRMSQPHAASELDNTFAEMMFGPTGRQIAPRTNPPVEVVHWGSDANFANRHFVPSSEKDTREALEKEALGYMDCLQVNTSAATTRPSSPSPHHNGELSPSAIKARNAAHEDDREAPPRKRRKSKVNDDMDELEDDMALSKAATARKRKSKSEGLVMATSPPAGVDGSGKRRKSSANGSSKQPRENLSEEQKRENHIRSEQKRRTVIKEGFDDLCELVPGLKSGGFSKSTMLAMSAEWLDELLKGNEILKAQLAGLRGRAYM
jgi:hypothetical protein